MTNINPIDALGDPTRRRLFERLREGPCSVNELVAAVPVSQPAVSQHLRVLKEAQLVRVEKQGRQRIYHLNPVGLAELRRYVESFWEDVLHAFGAEAARAANAAEEVQVEADKGGGDQPGDAAGASPQRIELTPMRRIKMNEQQSRQSVKIEPVRKQVKVSLPVAAAFELFTEGIGRWWPLASHSVGQEQAETCFFEGWAGGRIFEVKKDGSQAEWGRVLAWEPPAG